MKWVIENEKVDKDTKVAHHKSIMIHITNDKELSWLLLPLTSHLGNMNPDL